MGMERFFKKKQPALVEIVPEAKPISSGREGTAADLGMTEEGVIIDKTPAQIEEAAWAESDKEQAERRKMTDEVKRTMDEFRGKLAPMIEALQKSEKSEGPEYASDIDARSLLKELAQDLQETAKKFGVYVNPRENPEAFEFNSHVPRGSGGAGRLRDFTYTIRKEIESFIEHDTDAAGDPKQSAKLLQYAHQQDLETGHKDQWLKRTTIVSQLEREILYDIFKDPRA